MSDFLKVSRVTPIDKGGDAADPSNYGPISTLYSFAQIFEKLVYLQVSTYLKRYKILINFRDNIRSYNRVGHLILRALAIRASNLQNALARISFHSPNSLPPPPPPGQSNHFSHLV